MWDTLYVYIRQAIYRHRNCPLNKKSMILNLLAAAVWCDRVPYCDDLANPTGARSVKVQARPGAPGGDFKTFSTEITLLDSNYAGLHV